MSVSHVTLVPDEPEDMWHAYNLVAAGDRLRSTTIRLDQMIHVTYNSDR